jgi:hypothetical protein
MEVIKMLLKKYEQETIYIYNEEEKTATVYTHNKALIKRLEEFSMKCPELYKLLSQDENSKTFIIPKRYLGNIRLPRTISEERKQSLRENATKARQGK